MSVTVYLGNPAGIERVKHDDPTQPDIITPLEQPSTYTTVGFAEDFDTADHKAAVVDIEALWPYHSSGDISWVRCDDDPDFAARIAGRLGVPVHTPPAAE